jgi:Flp pilus assembly pilin Flp
MASFLHRFRNDQRGAHVVEMAIAVSLFAMVAAFGFFTMGDAVADYFVTLKDNFANGVSFAGDYVPVDSGGGGGGGGNGGGNGGGQP